MDKILNDIIRSVRDGFVSMTLKANDLAKVGRLKIEVATIKHNITKLFEELGERVYQLSTVDQQAALATDALVQSLVNRIRELQAVLEEKRQQAHEIFYQEVLNEAEPRATTAATSSSSNSAASAKAPSESPSTDSALKSVPRRPNIERQPPKHAEPDFEAEAAGEGLG
ncbi:MAG: hypothetical protein ONA90_06405 [candidate division KSB1 bacterium]|nr:hypothetical protein [candidate division KSB1 bacterium]